MPDDVDQVTRKDAADAIQRTGLLAADDPGRLVERLRSFALGNRDAFLAQFPDLTIAERSLIGLVQSGTPATEPAVAPAPVAAEQAADQQL